LATLKPGSTVAAGSALRAIGAQRQLEALALKGRAGRDGGGPWKGLTGESIRRTRSQLQNRRGRLYDAIRHGRGAVSMRHVREEGLANLESVLVVLIAHSDRKTGWIGDPKRRGLPWQLDELFLRAFGPSVANELAMDRLWGWIRVLKSCGLLQVLERAESTPVGDRAIVAIKFLTRRFFDLVGLTAQMAIHQHLEKMHKSAPHRSRQEEPAQPIRPPSQRSGQPQLLANVLTQSLVASKAPGEQAAIPRPSRSSALDPGASTPPPVPLEGTPHDHIEWIKALLK
jgi:hypothetical protein